MLIKAKTGKSWSSLTIQPISYLENSKFNESGRMDSNKDTQGCPLASTYMLTHVLTYSTNMKTYTQLQEIPACSPLHPAFLCNVFLASHLPSGGSLWLPLSDTHTSTSPLFCVHWALVIVSNSQVLSLRYCLWCRSHKRSCNYSCSLSCKQKPGGPTLILQ